MKLGVRIFFFKIPEHRTIFNFSCNTPVFVGLGALFGTFFVNFLSFFHAKLQFFVGLGALFGTFLLNFLSFFHAKFQFFERQGGLYE